VNLLVLTTSELVPAYRLAGTRALGCDDVGEAEEALRAVLDEGHQGVLAVHQPFLDDLDSGLRRELESLDSVLVAALPSGEASRGSEDRRERLRRMLREAIGYEMTFATEGDE
jgi:vacuolar-type H+-ATPase subunit F/Vma7